MAGEGLETVQYFKKSLIELDKNKSKQQRRLSALGSGGLLHERTIVERRIENIEHEIGEIERKLVTSWKTGEQNEIKT